MQEWLMYPDNKPSKNGRYVVMFKQPDEGSEINWPEVIVWDGEHTQYWDLYVVQYYGPIPHAIGESDEVPHAKP